MCWWSLRWSTTRPGPERSRRYSTVGAWLGGAAPEEGGGLGMSSWFCGSFTSLPCSLMMVTLRFGGDTIIYIFIVNTLVFTSKNRHDVKVDLFRLLFPPEKKKVNIKTLYRYFPIDLGKF